MERRKHAGVNLQIHVDGLPERAGVAGRLQDLAREGSAKSVQVEATGLARQLVSSLWAVPPCQAQRLRCSKSSHRDLKKRRWKIHVATDSRLFPAEHAAALTRTAR